MKLITVFFPGATEGTFRKAIISDDEIEYFKSLGAESRPDKAAKRVEPKPEAPEEEDDAPPEAPDPEKGWGQFGSVEWHQNQIRAMDSKRKIAGYIKKLCGTKMKTKNITIERVKANALTNIRRAANGSQSE